MKGCLLVILAAVGAFWFLASGDDPNDKTPAPIKGHEEIRRIIEGADHVGVYTVEGETDLRGFVSSMLAYQPWWLDHLYRIRAVLVRLMGMKQGEVPTHISVAPEKIPMKKGSAISIFKVVAAKENSYWLANASDKHLSAHVGVVMEPSKDRKKTFHLLIAVHYKNWAGPVYFNIIKPFEKIIVKGMAREGARGGLVF